MEQIPYRFRPAANKMRAFSIFLIFLISSFGFCSGLLFSQGKPEALYKMALSQVKSQKYKEAWKTLDALVKLEPDLKPKLPFVKFTMLAQFNEEKAYNFARDLVKKNDKSTLLGLGAIALCIVYKEIPIANPDLNLAIGIIESNRKVRKGELRSEQIALAEAYYLQGRLSDAYTLLHSEVEAMEADPKSSHKEVEMYERRLLQYKKALDKVGKN